MADIKYVSQSNLGYYDQKIKKHIADADAAIKENLEGQLDVVSGALDAEIERAKAAENGLSSSKADKTQVATDIAAAVKVEEEARIAAVSGVQGAVDTLSGTHATDKKALEDAIATKAAQTALDAVSAVANAAATKAEFDDAVEALEAEDARIAGLVTAEASRAAGVEADFEERISEMELFWDATEDNDGVVNKLKEIQKYIAEDESGAAAMAGSIQDNADAIEAMDKAYKAADQTLQGNIDTLAGTVATKAAASDVTALAGRVSTAEGKITANEEAIAELQEAVGGEGSVGDMIDDAVAAEAALRIAGDEAAEASAAAALKAAQDAQAAADAAQGEVDALEIVVDAKAAQADLTALAGRVTTAEGKITTLQTEMDAVEALAAANKAAHEANAAAIALKADQTALTAETNRATGEEARIEAKIDAFQPLETSEIDSLFA